MNTFGSDLSKILSAREQVHAVGEVPADVPVIKADTIKKEDQKEDQRETDQKEDQKKDQRETEQKESEV